MGDQAVLKIAKRGILINLEDFQDKKRGDDKEARELYSEYFPEPEPKK